MTLHRLTGTDAFLVVDLPGAPAALGVVRCARKILVDGAEALARSVTYGAAALGYRASGASAGINAEGDARDAAVAAFLAEAPDLVGDAQLVLTAGKGVTAEEVSALRGPAPEPDRVDLLVAASAVSATRAALGELQGREVVVEALGARSRALVEAFTAAGANATESSDAETPCDVWCPGSKVGLVDHEVAAAIGATTIVPAAPLAVTARGLAVARRRDIVVLPDFLTLAGPLIATLEPAAPTGEALHARIAELVGRATSAVVAHEHGPLLGACFAAEDFLRTWCDELPFGRPLA